MTYSKMIEPDLLNNLVIAHRDGRITLDEIKSFVKSEMGRVYNSILISLECNCISYDGKNDIFKREFIHGLIEEKDFPIFSYLKEKGYIGVCGAGYIMERPKITMTEEEHQAVMRITFGI